MTTTTSEKRENYWYRLSSQAIEQWETKLQKTKINAKQFWLVQNIPNIFINLN